MTRATFTLEIPELQAVFDHIPGCQIRLLSVRNSKPGELLVWVTGAGPESIADALEADTSVEEWRQIESHPERTLCRITFRDEVSAAEIYDRLTDLDGAVGGAVGRDGTWTLDLFFPSREAVSAFDEYARETGCRLELQSISDEGSATVREAHGLTEPQREVLVAAMNKGYFSVPKETTLVELAEDLGVSDQAVSERLRRGMYSLVESALAREADVSPTQ